MYYSQLIQMKYEWGALIEIIVFNFLNYFGAMYQHYVNPVFFFLLLLLNRLTLFLKTPIL